MDTIPGCQRLLADLLRACGHPDLADVEPTGTAVVARCADESKVFVRVAHIQAKGERIPAEPSWPGQLRGDAMSSGRR